MATTIATPPFVDLRILDAGVLQELDDEYYIRDFDAVAYELSQLQVGKNSGESELIAEERTSILEVCCILCRPMEFASTFSFSITSTYVMGRVICKAEFLGLTHVDDGGMQVIGALLTRHVLNNYTKFVEGIDDIAKLQVDLQLTLTKIREARQCIQSSSEDVAQSLRICENSKKKQKAGELLDNLERIKVTKDLDDSLRSESTCRQALLLLFYLIQ